jgi:hypothetical protein
MENITDRIELVIINMWDNVETKTKIESTPNMYHTCDALFDVIWENDVKNIIVEDIRYKVDEWRI